ncbi:hypothetical protein [Campylobacter portucalensis]|nr:hypothetical protein [Campylobacter portucalensis]
MINECEKISKFSGEIEINESFLELKEFVAKEKKLLFGILKK